MMNINRRSAKYIIILGLLLVLTYSITATAGVPDEAAAKDICDKFVDAQNRGDVETMSKYAIDTRQNSQETIELYRSLLDDESECIESIDFNEFHRQVTKSGVLLIADSTVTYKNGYSDNISLKFIKDEGDWKLYVTGD